LDAISSFIDPERSRTKRRSTGSEVGFLVWIPQLAAAEAGMTLAVALLEPVLPPVPAEGVRLIMTAPAPVEFSVEFPVATAGVFLVRDWPPPTGSIGPHSTESTPTMLPTAIDTTILTVADVSIVFLRFPNIPDYRPRRSRCNLTKCGKSAVLFCFYSLDSMQGKWSRPFCESDSAVCRQRYKGWLRQ
jgi:hypothetical protein